MIDTSAPEPTAELTADAEPDATAAPVAEVDVATSPQTEAPVVELDVVTPPQTEALVVEQDVVTSPRTEAPVAEQVVVTPPQPVEKVKSADVATIKDVNLRDLIAEVVAHQANGNADHLALELADRLEKLTERLRAEDFDVVMQELAQGDRLDVLVAGFLAGYAAVRKD